MKAKQKKAIDILISARNLLAQPYSWSKGMYYRPDSRAPSGYSYCALGALFSLIDEKYSLAVNDMARNLLEKEISQRVIDWNDVPERRKSEVLAAFDKTIERAKRDWA